MIECSREDISPFTWADTVEGVVANVEQLTSPNFDERINADALSLIVVHYISLPAGHFGGNDIKRLFTNTLDFQSHGDYSSLRDLRVSAHFLVERSGTVTQFVACSRRAWHAGVSSWRGRDACNEFSIGIELEGDRFQTFEPRQIASLQQLIFLLRERYSISDVVGHEHICPGRKDDPGPGFDWSCFD